MKDVDKLAGKLHRLDPLRADVERLALGNVDQVAEDGRLARRRAMLHVGLDEILPPLLDLTRAEQPGGEPAPSPAKNCATMDNKANGASIPEHPVITLTWSTQAILRAMPSTASTLRHSCIRAMKSATKLGFIARPAKAQVQFRRGKGREKSKEFSEHHNLRLDVSIHCA